MVSLGPEKFDKGGKRMRGRRKGRRIVKGKRIGRKET